MNIKMVVALMLVMLSSNIVCLQEILDAIDHDQVNVVKELLKEKALLSVQERDLLLKAAQDSVKMHKRKTESFFSSGRDMLRFLGGAALSGVGGFVAFAGIGTGAVFALVPSEDHRFTVGSFAIGGAGAALGLTGLWQVYRGITLASAYNGLHKAREIENAIHRTAVEKEAQPGN
jgi:hypothetical protein